MPKPGNFCNRLRENTELPTPLFSVRQWERWTLKIKEHLFFGPHFPCVFPVLLFTRPKLSSPMFPTYLLDL